MIRNITIQITARGIAILLTALALVWLVVVFDKILLILFLAILLAIGIDPIVDRLEDRRVPRSLAILITYIFLVGVLAAVVGLLVPVLIAEFSQLSTNLPRITQSVLALPATLIAPRFPSLARALPSRNQSVQVGSELGPHQPEARAPVLEADAVKSARGGRGALRREGRL